MNNMKQKITVLLVGFLLTLGISSCVKDSAPELGSKGNTIFKFNEGPRKDFYYLPFTGTQTATVTFTRDANSAASLQKPAEVVVLEDATLIPTGYTELPVANFSYASSDAGLILTSGKITAIRFAAGEFSKKIKITLTGSAWTDLSLKYAKAYKITDVAGNQLSAGQGGLVATFAIKNIWDGVYEVTSGEFDDVTSGGTWSHINTFNAANGYPNSQYTLKTFSATKIAYWAATPFSGFQFGRTYLFNAAGGGSGYGSLSPIFEFNPTTNAVVSVTNSYGQPASNTRSFRLDPTGVNMYDPETKTIQVKYQMLQPSVITTAPHVRTTITETLKYVGPTN
jgi:hypothetical protein